MNFIFLGSNAWVHYHTHPASLEDGPESETKGPVNQAKLEGQTAKSKNQQANPNYVLVAVRPRFMVPSPAL